MTLRSVAYNVVVRMNLKASVMCDIISNKNINVCLNKKTKKERKSENYMNSNIKNENLFDVLQQTKR